MQSTLCYFLFALLKSFLPSNLVLPIKLTLSSIEILNFVWFEVNFTINSPKMISCPQKSEFNQVKLAQELLKLNFKL